MPAACRLRPAAIWPEKFLNRKAAHVSGRRKIAVSRSVSR